MYEIVQYLSLLYFKNWWFCTKVYEECKIINRFWYWVFILGTPKEIVDSWHAFTYKAIKQRKMYNFIQGTKRDCWFCTIHTLLRQIINLWSRVLKESMQFYCLVGKFVQNHQSVLVYTMKNKGTKRDWW